MAAQQHIIGKVALDLTVGKEEGHFALQQRWADMLKDKVVPALSEIFDRQVPADEIWRVGKLTIDLDRVTEKMSDREIAEKIVGQIRESLEKYRASANGHFEKIPIEMAELDSLIFFLQNGHLPEEALGMDVNAVFRKNVEANFTGLTAAIMRQLGGANGMAKQTALRMARQFHEEGLLVFLKKYISENSGAGLGWLLVFYEKLAASKGISTRRLKEHFWVVFFRIIFDITLESKRFGEIFYHQFLNEIGKKNKGLGEAWKAVPENLPGQKGTGRKAISQKEKNENEEREKESADVPSSIYCKHAGIVLLHPFIPRLFLTTGLLADDGKSFKNNKKKGLAIHLLHFLATGQEHAKETDLALMKFLCGQKIALSIRQTGGLKKGYKDNADEMLRAAISHWAALKSTSPDGLREAFLQRQGRLTKKQHGHLLEMESKAHDILLGQLPWGMSIVHFPWMENPLWVQWG